MFNIVIDDSKEVVDPLIIKDNVTDIIQSIEEQLYNVNINYRTSLRSIKNKIKSLSNISESRTIFLEDEYVTDENIISYITNVLEVTLDSLIYNLSSDSKTKMMLESVTCVNDLYDIPDPDVNIFKEILEETKNLFNIYSEFNPDLKVSTTTFYNILDSSIKSAVQETNINPNIDPKTQELNNVTNKIYEHVVGNLEDFVGVDIIETFDKIKVYSSEYVNINEARRNQPNAGTTRNTNFLFGFGAISVFGAWLGTIGIGLYNFLKVDVPRDIDVILKAPMDTLPDEAVKKLLGYADSPYADPKVKGLIAIKLSQMFDRVKGLIDDPEKISYLQSLIQELKERQERLGLSEFLFKAGPWMFAVGGLYLAYRGVELLISKKLDINYLTQYKLSLSIKNDIEKLRKDVIADFGSEIKTSFTNLDADIKDIENRASRSNDVITAYDANIRYTIGSYSILLYATMLALKKEGTSINTFRSVGELYDYNGFSSYKSKEKLKRLNSLHDKVIKLDTQFVKRIDTIFNILKQEINKNSRLVDIVSVIPQPLLKG